MGMYRIKDATDKPLCVFVHIPKCAGTSIRRGFFQDRCEGPVYYDKPEAWHGLPVVAVVRHPVSRMISAWRMWKYGIQAENGKTEWPTGGQLDIAFSEFAEIAINRQWNAGERTGGKVSEPHRSIRHHCLPATHPIHGLQHAIYMLHKEALDKQWRLLCANIGVPWQPLPALRPTFRPSMREGWGIPGMSYDLVCELRRYYDADYTRCGYKYESWHKG